MTILIDDSIIGMWFLPFPGGDFLAAINRLEDGKLDLKSRFRRYRSADAWDGKDTKSWRNFVVDLPVQDAIEKMRAIVAGMQSLEGCGQSTELIRGEAESALDFMVRLQAMPFAHCRDGRFKSETLAEDGPAQQYLLRRKKTGAPLLLKGEPFTILAEDDAAARITARDALVSTKLHVNRSELSLVRIEERGTEIVVPWTERVF